MKYFMEDEIRWEHLGRHLSDAELQILSYERARDYVDISKSFCAKRFVQSTAFAVIIFFCISRLCAGEFNFLFFANIVATSVLSLMLYKCLRDYSIVKTKLKKAEKVLNEFRYRNKLNY